MTRMRTCVCCQLRHDVSEGRYIGPQDARRGRWALLHLCPGCGTTYTAEIVQDAARCAGCDHLILGDAEDPKIVVLWRDEAARDRISVCCADCACANDVASAMRTVQTAREFVRMAVGHDVASRRATRGAMDL